MPFGNFLTRLPPHCLILRFIKELADKSNSYLKMDFLTFHRSVCNITALTFHTMYSLKKDKGISFIKFKGLSSCNFQGSDRIEIYCTPW
jgi:hypothetical protein